eukprot:m.103069 g.103069  ORF g.103069 m.103069 type:complete len:123 (-) comp51553_c0_seq22:528-896(-)
MQRRIRVETLKIYTGKSAQHLYENVNPSTSLAVLTQKVICVALDETLKESRTVLRSWLIQVLFQYNEYLTSINASMPSGQLDLLFSRFKGLSVRFPVRGFSFSLAWLFDLVFRRCCIASSTH